MIPPVAEVVEVEPLLPGDERKLSCCGAPSLAVINVHAVHGETQHDTERRPPLARHPSRCIAAIIRAQLNELDGHSATPTNALTSTGRERRRHTHCGSHISPRDQPRAEQREPTARVSPREHGASYSRWNTLRKKGKKEMEKEEKDRGASTDCDAGDLKCRSDRVERRNGSQSTRGQVRGTYERHLQKIK